MWIWFRSRGFRIGWATRPFTYVLAGAHDDETQIDEIYGHAREWGIDYVILDFHYDFKENLSWERTAMEVYRRCYQLVRRAIGKAVFLEACGAPYGTVLGLADALRMSRDWRPDREQTELPGFKALYFLNGEMLLEPSRVPGCVGSAVRHHVCSQSGPPPGYASPSSGRERFFRCGGLCA